MTLFLFSHLLKFGVETRDHWLSPIGHSHLVLTSVVTLLLMNDGVCRDLCGEVGVMVSGRNANFIKINAAR